MNIIIIFYKIANLNLINSIFKCWIWIFNRFKKSYFKWVDFADSAVRLYVYMKSWPTRSPIPLFASLPSPIPIERLFGQISSLLSADRSHLSDLILYTWTSYCYRNLQWSMIIFYFLHNKQFSIIIIPPQSNTQFKKN